MAARHQARCNEGADAGSWFDPKCAEYWVCLVCTPNHLGLWPKPFSTLQAVANNWSYRILGLKRHNLFNKSGNVNTTWKLGTGKSSSSLACIHFFVELLKTLYISRCLCYESKISFCCCAQTGSSFWLHKNLFYGLCKAKPLYSWSGFSTTGRFSTTFGFASPNFNSFPFIKTLNWPNNETCFRCFCEFFSYHILWTRQV